MDTQFVQNVPRCPKFTSNLAIFGSFLQKFSSYFKTGTIFWVFLKRSICLPSFLAKMWWESQRLGWTRQNFAPKLPKIAKHSYIKCNNSNSIQYFNIFLCFSERACLGTMISSKKLIIEPTAGVNEAKICPKIAENCKYSNL